MLSGPADVANALGWSPTRLSKKSNFGIFAEKRLLKTKELWALTFSFLGFFDSLNYGVQATAYSLRFAALCFGFQPRLTPSVRLVRAPHGVVTRDVLSLPIISRSPLDLRRDLLRGVVQPAGTACRWAIDCGESTMSRVRKNSPDSGASVTG